MWSDKPRVVHAQAMVIRAISAGPTEVLIVGVAHLNAGVPSSALEAGLRILERWAPDVVAVERIPGHLVEQYERRGGAFADFPVSGAPAARHAAATVASQRSWDVWQARRIATDPDRSLNDRVLGWLLAREPCNALLLPWEQAQLPTGAVAALADLAGSPSEVVRVGVALARALGHSEVAHFDDHAGVSLLEHFPSDWSETVEDFQAAAIARLDSPPGSGNIDSNTWMVWENAATPAFRHWAEEVESRAMAMADGDAVHSGVLRARHGQWRSRNLAMAARLREATMTIPGGRLVAIVGSSHERPLRAALSVDQHDLRLTAIADVQQQFSA